MSIRCDALTIKDLSVIVENKTILHTISLCVKKGEIHALMGPNGSGKSTLAYALIGHPAYQVLSGDILINDTSIASFTPHQRAQKGLFLAFQHPYEIPGVSVFCFLHEAYKAVKNKAISPADFKIMLEQRMTQLAINPEYAHRGVNEGFSGGEKKQLEILQLLVLQPDIVILDEIDSGLDIDALKVVAHGIMLAKQENPDMSIILITHYQRILHYITPQYIHIMHNGTFTLSGDETIADILEERGYDAFR